LLKFLWRYPAVVAARVKARTCAKTDALSSTAIQRFAVSKGRIMCVGMMPIVRPVGADRPGRGSTRSP